MGYNFSMLNYDTIANGVPGSMNLFWNQAAMHNSVYPSLFMTANMGNFGFSPYMNNFNNNWLLDPGFALNNAFGQFGMSCPWTMGGGYTPGGTSSSAKTDEEIDAEEKRKELDKIISELKSAKIITDAEKKKIDNARKEAKDAGEDLVGQYEAGKAKFDEIISGKEDKVKQEILEKGDKLKLEDGTKIMEARQKVGLGELSTTSDLTMTGMASGAITSSDKVLEYIEAFQEQNGMIIEKVIGYGNEGTESNAFNKLKEALIGKANSLRSKLDADSKSKLMDAIEALNDCTIKYDTDNNKTLYEPSSNDIKNAFNELYVLTRITAAMVLDNKIKAKYGKHSTVFNKDFIKEAVINDLANDGYDTPSLDDIKIDETALADTSSMTEEERTVHDAEQEKRNAESNTKTINEILTLSSAYESEKIENGIYKLTPTQDYRNYDNDACTYYYNPTNGKLTKADTDGNYDPNAKSVGLEAFKNKATKSLPSGTNCLEEFFDNNDVNFKDSYTNKENISCYMADYEKNASGKSGAKLDAGALSCMQSEIDSIGNNLKNNTFINPEIIDKTNTAIMDYYRKIFSEHVRYTKDHSGTVKKSMQTTKGAGTKEFIAYEHIFENDGHGTTYGDKWGRVQNATCNHDPKVDTGLAIVYDNDGFRGSWFVFINNHVLIKKYEYFLSLEIEKAKDNLKNS